MQQLRMNTTQIQQLSAAGQLETTDIQIVETHASWVLLTDQFAYKIKKPVKFSFLDFSTLEKRHFYCKRELELNQRLAPHMYLSVLPIVQHETQICIGGEGEVLDYALKMKRMDNTRQMNDLLEQDAVSKTDIQKLAEKVAIFHRHAEVITTPMDIAATQTNFADILRIRDFLSHHLKKETVHILEEAVQKSNSFLNQHAERFQKRSQSGFIVDGHGDLHSGNIFLLDEPVIFDCLEFNDDFRRLDMLDEVAFLCLDLDFYRHPDLEIYFLEQYLEKMPCLRDEEDQQIFDYYKLYRANVRLKVMFLKAKQQRQESDSFYQDFNIAKQYFELFEKYLYLI